MASSIENIIITNNNRKDLFPKIIFLFDKLNEELPSEKKNDLNWIFTESFKKFSKEPLKNTTDLWNLTALQAVRTAMETEETVSYLRDQEVSVFIRSEVMTGYLQDCFKSLRAEFPSVSQLHDYEIKERMSLARIDDSCKNCNSRLVFGMNNDFSSSTLFGAMFHELMHNILFINFNFFPINLNYQSGSPKDLEKASIHEFICDLAALAMFSKIAGGNKVLFENWTNDFMKSLKYREEVDMDGNSWEEHNAARVLLNNIIEEARKNNLDLSDLFPRLLTQSIEVIKELKSKEKQSKCTFSDFIDRLISKINEQMKSSGMQFTYAPHKKDLYKYLDQSGSMFSLYEDLASISNLIIKVPKVQIVPRNRPYTNVRPLITEVESSVA